MKKTLKMWFLASAALGLICSIAGYSQNPPASGSDWFRVQSDDGEFSVEVPTKYRFFKDKEGFTVVNFLDHIPVRNVEMLNSYTDGTLVSFERYRTQREALASLYDLDSRRKGILSKSSETSPNGNKFAQIIWRTDKSYVIRQYSYTKQHIYVFTAATRGPESATMRRFLDSVVITMKPPASLRNDAVVFAKLTQSTIRAETDPTVMVPRADSTETRKLESDSKPLVIIFNPLPFFSLVAEGSESSGTVLLRLDFCEDGSISNPTFIKTLPSGLSREALMAGMRIKFLPAEKDGVPVMSTKVLEYTFSRH